MVGHPPIQLVDLDKYWWIHVDTPNLCLLTTHRIGRYQHRLPPWVGPVATMGRGEPQHLRRSGGATASGCPRWSGATRWLSLRFWASFFHHGATWGNTELNWWFMMVYDGFWWFRIASTFFKTWIQKQRTKVGLKGPRQVVEGIGNSSH